MAPIRWFSHRGPWLGRTLLGGCLALVLTAAPASAEISSVDAYGGQAQVLGKPVHHHRTTGARGAGRESGQSTNGGSEASGGGSAESSSGAVSHSNSGSNPGAPATPSGSHSAPKAGGENSVSGAHGSGAGISHGAGAAGTGAASGASGGGQSPPIAAANAVEVSDGSLSLSALDVLLLVAVCVGLGGVGVVIRRWSRQAE